MSVYLLRCLLAWENPYCPDRCNQPHDEPDPDYDEGTWTCPTTGTEFWYEGVVGRGEWHPQGRYRIYPTYVPPANAYYDDPWEAGWGMCSRCGDWHSSGSLHYDDWGGEDYCSDCYEPEPEYDADYESGGDGSHTPRCEYDGAMPGTFCTEAPTFVHPVTEALRCGGHKGAGYVRIPQGRKRVSLAVA